MKTPQQLKELEEIIKKELRNYLDLMTGLAIKGNKLTHLGGIVDIYLNSDFFKENEQEVHQYFKEFGWDSKVIGSTITENKVANYVLSIKPT